MMDVVQQMMLEAEPGAQRVEQLRHVIQVLRGRPDVLAGDRRVGGLVVHLVLRHAVGGSETRDAALRANRLVAHRDVAGDLVHRLGNVAAIRVTIDHHAVATAPAEKLVERQLRDLRLDVPQCRVDGGDRAHRHRTAPPVRAAIEVLPRILDAGRIAADQRGDHMVAEIGGDRQLAPVEGGVADAVDAFVGLDLQRDEVAARASDDDAAFGDLHDVVSATRVEVQWPDHLTTVYARSYDRSRHADPRSRGLSPPFASRFGRDSAPGRRRRCRTAIGGVVPLTAVEPRRLYRQIADQIAQLIAKGEFPAGSRLPAERELAVSLGVSRTSVREAIISLEMSGLVEVRVGTGIFVTAPQASAAGNGPDAGPGPFELLDARKLVEGEIAALAAKNGSDDDFAALLRSVDFMSAHVDDFAVRESADREFHLRIAKATGNSSLELVVDGLWNQRAGLWGAMQRHFHTRELALQTVRDHAAIARAIAARDGEAARAAMHRHIGRVAREFQRGVEVQARRSS